MGLAPGPAVDLRLYSRHPREDGKGGGGREGELRGWQRGDKEDGRMNTLSAKSCLR